jgi:hypothetical protein
LRYVKTSPPRSVLRRFFETSAVRRSGSGIVRHSGTQLHSGKYRHAHWMRYSPVCGTVWLCTAVSYRTATGPAYRGASWQRWHLIHRLSRCVLESAQCPFIFQDNDRVAASLCSGNACHTVSWYADI